MTQALLSAIEFLVVFFGSWTLGYHVVLFARLPAWSASVAFLIVFMLALAFLGPRWKRGRRMQARDGWTRAGLSALALASGLLTLVVCRPSDNDDYSFFQRALVQPLGKPFLLTHTGDNISGLPQLSILHVMTSYEPLLGLSASRLGLDPLSAYQNGAAFFGAALLPLVYFLLYRQFRLSRPVALLSAACALGFLLVDGNLLRSFGNVGLVRLWQGKTMLWTVLIPVTDLLAFRFLFLPSWRRLGLVAAAAVCAVGLSNSGIVLIPVLLFGISLAYLFCCRPTRKRLRRALLLNLASGYCVLIILAVKTGVLHLPHDMQGWVLGWPPTWWPNLKLVLGGRAELLRDLLILAALPLAGLRRPLGRLVVMLSVAFCLLFANPLLGPLWMRTVEPASYWRYAYLFPLPWCAGLAGACVAGRQWPARTVPLRAGLAALALLAVFHACQYTTLSLPPATFLKRPGEYRMTPHEMAFARLIAAQIHHRNVLASEDMACVLALTEPDIRLESGRSQDTRQIFSNAGMGPEGERRMAAQDLVTTGSCPPASAAAFRQSLRQGVDAVVVSVQAFPSVSKVMASAPGPWRVAARNADYVLLLRG